MSLTFARTNVYAHVQTYIRPPLPAFLPRSRPALKSAVDECLKQSPKTGCSAGQLQGPIGQWDVSRVTDMNNMFSAAKLFGGDLSRWDLSLTQAQTQILTRTRIFRWDVSNVRDMSGMFHWASSFDSDISKWGVSRVTDMDHMFSDAKAFNIDISKWDVSRVANMDGMFRGATLFKHGLCGAAWVHSKASTHKTHTYAYAHIQTVQGYLGTFKRKHTHIHSLTRSLPHSFTHSLTHTN